MNIVYSNPTMNFIPNRIIPYKLNCIIRHFHIPTSVGLCRFHCTVIPVFVVVVVVVVGILVIVAVAIAVDVVLAEHMDIHLHKYCIVSQHSIIISN